MLGSDHKTDSWTLRHFVLDPRHAYMTSQGTLLMCNWCINCVEKSQEMLPTFNPCSYGTEDLLQIIVGHLQSDSSSRRSGPHLTAQHLWETSFLKLSKSVHPSHIKQSISTYTDLIHKFKLANSLGFMVSITHLKCQISWLKKSTREQKMFPYLDKEHYTFHCRYKLFSKLLLRGWTKT